MLKKKCYKRKHMVKTWRESAIEIRQRERPLWEGTPNLSLKDEHSWLAELVRRVLSAPEEQHVQRSCWHVSLACLSGRKKICGAGAWWPRGRVEEGEVQKRARPYLQGPEGSAHYFQHDSKPSEVLSRRMTRAEFCFRNIFLGTMR